MSIIKDYVDKVVKAISEMPEDRIRDAIDTLKAAHEQGKQVFLIGNGGSAACATHIAEDLQKGLKEASGKRFKVMSLADSAPLITAWANDSGYDCIFEEQIDSLLEPGDVVIAISGSGNSPNVLKAVEKANAMGAITMGWSGMGGGKLAGLVQKPIVIASDNMQRIEDAHMVLGHLIFACMMKECGSSN
jgi:D-sedoheptulose 7-phosphate isomerase